MRVSLREKVISKGTRKSLYLDFYPPIINSKTGEPTRREFLGLYLIAKPKSQDDRELNKEARIQAEGMRARRQLEIQAGQYGFVQRHSKEDFKQYLSELAETKRSTTSTYQSWTSSLNYLKAFHPGPLPFQSISPGFCNQFREYLLTCKASRGDRPLSRNSAATYFNRFKAAMGQAHRQGYLPTDLASTLASIRPQESKREFLTIEELQKLDETECEVPMVKSMALFMAVTGLRFSDVPKLRWGQIEKTKEHGHFLRFTQVKGKGQNTIYLTKEAVGFLGPPGDPDSPIFPGLKYSAWLNSKLREWVLQAGIRKKITWHCFRNTFTTLQLLQGTDFKTVSSMLGHASLRSIMPYVKTTDQLKRRAAHRIKIKGKRSWQKGRKNS